jgi:erythromycin esterase-like protein
MNNKKCELKEYLKILENKRDGYDSILAISQGIEYILIGESIHGTHEFYQMRAGITKRLILEKNSNAIAIEGDWPDVYNINRYVRGYRTIKSAIDALSGFKKFLIWMWRNDVQYD